MKQVAAVRLYTTDSYTLFNKPLREGQTPHPLLIPPRNSTQKPCPEAMSRNTFLNPDATIPTQRLGAKNGEIAKRAPMQKWRGF